MKTLAKFYPQGSVNCLEVMAIGNDLGMLTIQNKNGEQVLQVAASDITVQDKLANLPREISIADHGLLVIEASTNVDNWLDSSSSTGIASRLEKSTRLVLLSVVLVPLCLYGLFKYVLPSVAIVFADYVPDAAVELASKQTVYMLERALFEESTLPPELQENFQHYWRDIARQIDLQYPVKPVNFRASDLGPNALALPDGTIYMTDELVALFEEDFELMAAVMLHEVGHVEYRHSMRMVAESLVTTVALSYIFGDVSGALELFGGISTAAVHNQFTQKNEWEADNFAIDHLENVGLAPDAFARAMEKLSEVTGDEHAGQEYLQSHPLTSERIENARRLVKPHLNNN